MNLILFIHNDSSSKGTNLKVTLNQKVTGVKIQTIQTFNAFKARLKEVSDYNDEIFILLADSKTRLKELLSLIDLLDGKRLVLVLPDDTKDTLSIAHQFFPRFFTFVDSNYDDLCDVLKKMTTQKNI